MYAVLKGDTWEMEALAVTPCLQKILDVLSRGSAARKARYPQLYPEGVYDEIVKDPKAAVDFLESERNAFQRGTELTKDRQTVAVLRRVDARQETLRTNGGQPRYALRYTVVKLAVE